ncbi:MAG: long-chain fatty acid--CoA ligase [Intrasporangiaceae bacterium]|nr:long-chain fatty acid--CoA ligase [Intrasporangiaceae bacterium]
MSATTTAAEDRSVPEEREAIVGRTRGRTLIDVFMATCDANGGKPALVVKDGDGFTTLTWAEYRRAASIVAMALAGLGVGRGDFVALMLTNRPEHVIADVGTLLAGATPVSVYKTLTAEQVGYIAGNCDARVAIVEDATFLERWLEVADDLALEHLIVVDASDVDTDDPRVSTWADLLAAGQVALDDGAGDLEARWRSVKPDDAVTLIYTSGTTGPPKGVIITHQNLLYMLEVVRGLLDMQPGQRGISYLPLAHVAERMTTHYNGINIGGTIYFVPEVAQVLETLQEARPQMFMAVPRVWEKMQAALLAKIDADDRKGPLARRAIAASTAAVEARMAGRTPSLALRAQLPIWDKLVFSKIRDGLGLSELRYAISGAAPISPDLLVFYKALGIEILEVYGMTESTAVITANESGKVRIGTVGTALPGIEVRIADDGEILARGPIMTPGYWRRDEATAETIDTDGWLHTGDLGTMDDDGYVRIVGRKKELIITAGGKNLSPNNIEEAIKQRSPIVAQICAVGDDRPFIGALIVLDVEVLPGWCAANDVPFTSVAQAAEHPAVLAEVQRAIDVGNEHLARVEQVKQWRIVPSEWTAESEELTPSLKLKRNVIHSKYADVIDGLYASSA